jgi:hypothetical protein
VHDLSGRHLRLNSIQEADELVVTTPVHATADDLAFSTNALARTGIGCWISYYNTDRPLGLRRQDARRGLYYQTTEGKLAL